jgi:signal transduction histidine kinase
VTTQDLIEQLAKHRTVGSAPRTELEWLATHGTLRALNTGEVLSSKGRPVEALYIVLSGRLALFIDRGAGPNKLVEWREGDVTGLLPYSRLTVSPGDSRMLEPAQMLAIPREYLQAMTRECFAVTSILVHTMVDRTRMFTSNDLQNEKMVSLGKLSAGLAHELNNPASAIKRCASLLDESLQISEESARGLAAASLRESQIAAIDAVHASFASRQNLPARTELEQADREEAIADWLARHGLDTRCAEPLAETAMTFESLEQLVAAVEQPALSDALHWLASGCSIRNLSSKIQSSAAQISILVNAVKGFTHMDQANAAEPVDVCAGLADTVRVLQSKAHEKSVEVTLQLEPGLPKACGFAAELNQVWSNLIDNALDAAASGGKVEVTVNSESPNIVVRVADNGSGIPEDIRNRIFDPFFTTKPQGQGIGLGLDVARRLVRHNDGVIEFESHPGRTEFCVRLRIAGAQSA